MPLRVCVTVSERESVRVWDGEIVSLGLGVCVLLPEPLGVGTSLRVRVTLPVEEEAWLDDGVDDAVADRVGVRDRV